MVAQIFNFARFLFIEKGGKNLKNFVYLKSNYPVCFRFIRSMFLSIRHNIRRDKNNINYCHVYYERVYYYCRCLCDLGILSADDLKFISSLYTQIAFGRFTRIYFQCGLPMD